MNRPGDEFNTFVETRAAALHRSDYLLCGDWHLAHDLVQEALAKAYRHWGRVVRVDSSEAYVRRIVVNERRRDPPGRDLPGLLGLPACQRATVVLRYLDGLTERDTAAALNCSEGTVKSQ